MMDKKSLAMLEYPLITEKLASYASFSLSEAMARGLTPSTDPKTIQYKLELVREARLLLSVNDTIRLGGCIDILPLLSVVEKSGVLDGQTLYQIAYMMTVGRELGRSLSFHAAEYPKLAAIAQGLVPPHGLIEKINNTVNDHGEVLDSASEKLAGIRREIQNSYARLLGKLEKILRDSHYQPMLQEAIITQRNGRYVIPLKAEFKGQLKAIIHDQSASGATIFVEPLTTVELNNAYRELQLKERDEVHQILAALCAEIAVNAQQLKTIVTSLAEIDYALMCARYADDLKANEPILSPKRHKNGSPVIKLYQARHPLLPPEKAVPVDMVLDEDTYIVIITGPNTGGKTVSLKTLGLMILMMQSGLHIPAESGSELSLFDNVFSDIGDEQSIEQSLSTFSGHMTNQIRILNLADSKSMILLDELGSGTDPQEGSALARAIMQYVTGHHIPCFAATHFSELKMFAHATPGVTNASMEFDLKTLKPTYHLSIGLPGRSNALLIAKKLGLPQEILENAQNTITPSDTDTDSLLDEIHRQYETARKARSQADRSRSLAENARRELQQRLDQIEDEREKILDETRKAAQEQYQDLYDELTRIRKEARRSAAPLTTLDTLDKELKSAGAESRKASADAVKTLKLSASPLDDRPLKTGDKVRVRSLGTDSLAVINTIEKDEAEIQLGALRMRVPLNDLARKNEPDEAQAEADSALKSARPAESGKTTMSELFHASPGTEIDLRGLTAEEMTDRLDKYLDDAVLAGLPWVRIIHGKGTGKLRQVTRRILLDHPQVKYIEAGQDSEGGDGVTVAHMKN